jgi:ankyrin repeat protein
VQSSRRRKPKFSLLLFEAFSSGGEISLAEKIKSKLGKSKGSGSKDLVANSLRWIKANRLPATLIIIGTIVISLATFTDAIKKISDFVGDLTRSERQKSADELQKRKIDINALSMLRSAGEGDLETVNLLLKAGIPPNVKDSNGWTALHWASMKGHAPVVKLLISLQSDVDAKDNSGQTPLMEAAAYCHTDIVIALISGRANVQNQSSATALYWAAEKGCADTVETLIKAGVDANQTQKLGWTPLMAAAANGHLNVVSALIQAGADKNASNSKGKTAFTLAQENHHQEVADFLARAGTH